MRQLRVSTTARVSTRSTRSRASACWASPEVAVRRVSSAARWRPKQQNFCCCSDVHVLPTITVPGHAMFCWFCSEIDECDSTPCLNGGVCFQGLNIFSCRCIDGYTGLICENGKCHTGQLCENGRCSTNALKVHVYLFFALFSNFLCFVMTEIDECLSNPCLHNGTCTDLLNDVNCTCEVGYTGDRCETGTPDC